MKGSCLCGGVRYRIDGSLTEVMNCHCTMCRKAHGTAFRSRATVAAAGFNWLGGYELLTWYESSPGNHRGFCRVCGSPIVSRFDSDSAVYSLPMGALDDDPGVKPAMHIFTSNKAPWFDLADDLPQHSELPEC